MTIQIEISRGYKRNSWNIRVGDIEGSTTIYNITEEQLIKEIKEKLKCEGVAK